MNKNYFYQLLLAGLALLNTIPSIAQGTTCLTATSITVNGACLAATISDATQDAPTYTCSGTFRREGWYTFTISQSMNIFINATVTTRDLAIQLVSGGCITPTQVACVNNSVFSGAQSEEMRVNLAAGTYFIKIVNAGTNGNMNLSSLCVTGTASNSTIAGLSGGTLWLKANQGTSTTTNNAVLSNWMSASNSILAKVSQSTSGYQPLYIDGSGGTTTNRFNYNPFVMFDGSDDQLTESQSSQNFGDASSGSMSFYQVLGYNSGIVSCMWGGSNGSVKMKGDGIIAVSDGFGSSGTNNERRWTVHPYEATVQGVTGNINGLTYGGQNALTGTVNSNNIPDFPSYLFLGSNTNSGEYFQGGLGEVIFFNRALSTNENNRVESYLAVKYGITLGTSGVSNGGYNYLASDGSTTTWSGYSSASNTYTYNYHIIGIGRDDTYGLLQKQSHQYDDSVRIYKGSLASINSSNSSSFSADKSYVMLGSNTGKLCTTTAAIAEMPTGLSNCTLYSRLEREWRIQRTNMSETFNWDVALAPCGNPLAVNTTDLRLLVDDDGNFSNGGTQCYYMGDGTGISFSYANPYITVTGISTTHVPNNATKYITLASTNPLTPLPVQLIGFHAKLNDAQTVDLDWSTESETQIASFEIEKSTDFNNWTFLGTFPSNNSVSGGNHHTVDLYPETGTNYYRLTVRSTQNEVSDQRIDAVQLNQAIADVIFPNPSNGELYFRTQQKDPDLSITDVQGRLIPFSMIKAGEGLYQINCGNLANGLYTIYNNTNGQSFKWVIQE